MKQREILAQITGIGIVPVVRTPSAESAVKAIEAIYEGGIRLAEITMTVPGAVRVLEKLADHFGERMLLGAGTVLDPETCRVCMLAGAQFFVTTGLEFQDDRDGAPLLQAGLAGGADADGGAGSVGRGRRYRQDLPVRQRRRAEVHQGAEGPFPQIEMIPTGGVSLATAGDFLKAGACAVAVGGELIDSKTIREGSYDVIEERARQYLAAVVQARADMQGQA